jgi:hypothetical protein
VIAARRLGTLLCASRVTAAAVFSQMHEIEADREQRRRELTRTIGADDAATLADALRAAKQAYAVAMADLRQADVEPVGDWATWYAEYLLGAR